MTARLVLLARTSTEDLQSPADSLAWQRARAEQLAATVGGTIVEVVHDVGLSRSLPWKRRPEASALLDRVRQGHHGFDGIVCGEVQRAFGNIEQAMTTLPLLTHFGVGFYAPELGGRYDPTSESAEILLGAFVGMSRAERQRIKLRVKAAMTEQAKDGRWLGGRPPFGYRLVDTDVPHPNPSKARDGKRLRRLEIDPVAAEAVRRIFDMYVNGQLGYKNIAQVLTDDGVLSPSGHDPARNRHRLASRGAWTTGAVRSILMNPSYLGVRAWGRTRGEERLLDPEDVSMGSKRIGRNADTTDWVWATEATHPAIVSSELFAAAERIRVNAGRSKSRRSKTRNPYLLRGLLWCATCAAHGRQRRLEGTTTSGRALYRCRLSGPDYARHPGLSTEHPPAASISEARALRAVDRWIAELFTPERIEATITAMVEASNKPDPAADQRLADASRRLADAEARVENLRKAVEAGADPALVAEWTTTARRDRDDARRVLNAATPATEPVTRADIAALVGSMGEVAAKLAKATPAQRQKLYAQLGLRIDFTPGSTTLKAQLGASGAVQSVGGGT